MKLHSTVICLAASFCLSFSLFAQPALNHDEANANGPEELKPGVVVETVAKKSEAEKSGLQQGDVILRWSRGDSKGEIEFPFDLSLTEIEQAGQGEVTLEGLRGAEKQSWVLGPDIWGIAAVPNFQGRLLASYREGLESVQSGKLLLAAERWRSVARQVDTSSASWLRTWLFFHGAEVFANAREWKEADHAYRDASQQATGVSSVVSALVLRSWASTYLQRQDLENAEKIYERSLAESEKMGTESLVVAANLDSLGAVARNRGDPARAYEIHRRALAIREKLAPESLPLAASLNNLGNVFLDEGDLDKAEEYYRGALGIREKLIPGSIDLSRTFNGLGNVAIERGDLGKAEEYHLKSLSIRQKLAPNSLDVASSFNNLGNVLEKRGDLTKAEDYHRQALVIRQKLASNSTDVAASLINLAAIASDRVHLRSHLSTEWLRLPVRILLMTTFQQETII